MNWGKLKIIRELLGLSQGDISAITGINQKDISLLESGKKKFIPNEYIQFLYNYNVDLNSVFDDELPASLNNIADTPKHNTNKVVEYTDKSSSILHPNSDKLLHPILHPNSNLGLPKVVTVGEDEREMVSFVPAKSAAGYLNGYGDSEYVEHLPTIRIPNLGSGTHRAFEIVGHSMNPTLHNHSIGIGRWLETMDDIKDRRIYTIVTKSEGIVTKRVLNRISDSGRLILISDNQNKRDYPNILLDADEVLEVWYLRGALSFEFPEPDVLYNRVNDLEGKVTLLMDHFNRGKK